MNNAHAKAEEIVNRMFMIVKVDEKDEYLQAKQFAMAAVEEIILDCDTDCYPFWKKVKCEIENL